MFRPKVANMLSGSSKVCSTSILQFGCIGLNMMQIYTPRKVACGVLLLLRTRPAVLTKPPMHPARQLDLFERGRQRQSHDSIRARKQVVQITLSYLIHSASAPAE